MLDKAHLTDNPKDIVELGFLIHALIETTCRLTLHLSPNVWEAEVDRSHLGTLRKNEHYVQDYRNRNTFSKS
jgi:hypothetical protein